MNNPAIAIFTAKTITQIFDEGGSAAWVINRRRARDIPYAVCARNAYSDWGDGDEEHGSAFLIGKICGVAPAPGREGRWLIQFSEYAEIVMPNVWQGWRNPVRYTTLEELGIDLDRLEFKPIPPKGELKTVSTAYLENGGSPILSIDDAKRGLAKTFGVSVDVIEITIRG